MFDQKSDKSFVGPERSAMNAERCFFYVIAISVNEIKPARLREIDLVSCDGELASDHAPDLHVDFRSIEGGFVGHFHIVDSRILEHVAGYLFGLFPYVR